MGGTGVGRAFSLSDLRCTCFHFKPEGQGGIGVARSVGDGKEVGGDPKPEAGVTM